MIEKILDQNDIKFYQSNKDYERFNNLMLSTQDTRKLIAEQYVKENGFKLEWFSKKIQKFAQTNLSLEILLGVWLITSGKLKEERQLLAWLYANDIGIIL